MPAENVGTCTFVGVAELELMHIIMIIYHQTLVVFWQTESDVVTR